jgi:hypothetical protein
MSVIGLRRLEQQFLTGGQQISATQAQRLLDAVKDGGSVTAAEKAELTRLLARDKDKLEPAALDLLSKFLAPTPGPGPVPPANADVIKSISGSQPGSFDDDVVFLGRDGTVHGESNVPAYTRSYDSMKEGPLRVRHGSAAPASTVLSRDQQAALNTLTPGQALDSAARVFGASVDGFDKMANSKDFYDDKAEYWWGKCHAWTWSSLSTTVDKLVDVPGPEGQRGLWVGGQWLSRADLGDWMMAVSDQISVNDGNQIFKTDLSALDLLKGTTQYMMNNGGGVVGDVFNDKKKGHKEVWNQPFVSSDVTTKSLSGDVATKLLAQATKDGVTGAQVKQVTVVGTYGVEQSDDHEGAPGRSSKTWNMYVVADANGKALTAYMADDEKLKGMTGLPTTFTDDVPDYFWKPTLQAIDDTLAGRSNSTVNSNAHSNEFKFFVGTVLSKGVPGTTRTAFEKDFGALPAGAVDAAHLADLLRRYPGVANGYSPDQWKATFAARGLDAKAFGAAWP